MNWNKTLNPWGYAREIAEQLESEKVVCEAFAEELKATRQLLNEERRLRDDAAGDNTTLKTELSTALDALRIADERADKNEREWHKLHGELADLKVDVMKNSDVVRPDVLHNDFLSPHPFKIGGAGTFQTNQPVSFNERAVNVGAIPKGTRRPKANSTEKRTATAPGGAELHLKPARQNNKAQEAAYAEAVQRKTK